MGKHRASCRVMCLAQTAIWGGLPMFTAEARLRLIVMLMSGLLGAGIVFVMIGPTSGHAALYHEGANVLCPPGGYQVQFHWDAGGQLAGCNPADEVFTC